MKRLLIILLSLIPLIVIYSFNLINGYGYYSDFGRDLVDIFQITQGNLTLLGPKLSFGGIHAGPYYYYLFAPILKIFHYLPEALLIFNVLLFIASFVFGALWLHKKEKFNLISAILAMYWLGLTPYFIFSGRGPGNAFSYLPLMFLLLIIFPWLTRQKRLINWLIYGFFVGIVFNTHLVTIIIFASIFLANFQLKTFKKYLALGIGVIISYAPILLFELRHNFVIFTNTFINKSYLAFTQNTNLPNPLKSSSNPLENFGLLLGHFSTWSGISFAILLIIVLILAIKTKSKSPIVLGSFLSLIILTFVARSQLAIHYFFPFILVAQVSIIYLLRSKTILILLIIVTLFHFPNYLYANSPQTINTIRQFTSKLLQSDLMKRLNRDSFNLLVVQENNPPVLGWNYRYFLILSAYKPLAADTFDTSQNLLMIAETNINDVNSIQSWEISEFGNKKVVNMATISGEPVFVFEKEHQ